MVDEDPHYVVRRFESGRFAVDSQVREVYQRALTMTEVPHIITYMLLSVLLIYFSDLSQKIDLLAEEAVTTRPTSGQYCIMYM